MEVMNWQQSGLSDFISWHIFFELAHTGTIFPDEIGDISLKTQAKILQVIQEQEFERVGGSKILHTEIWGNGFKECSSISIAS